jgi:Uma2 family endonuclease
MSVGAAPQRPAYFTQSGFRPLSVAGYHTLIDMGELTEDDRVELLEGHMVLKMPQNRSHSIVSTTAEEHLRAAKPPDWRLLVGKPITLPDSESEPDITLVRRDWAAVRSRHPEPPDVGLVVEVADTSLVIDRTDKTRIYARANLPVYWIINVVDRQVEAYTDPRPADPVPAYAARTDYRVGDAVPLVLDGQTVAQISVADLLG